MSDPLQSGAEASGGNGSVFLHHGRRAVLFGLGAVVLLTLGYILIWWNRYLAPNGSAEIVGMTGVLRDRLPYRDYYYQAPPGMLFVWATLGKLFGPRLIVFWAFGVIVRIAGAALLYLALLEVCAPAIAACAVVLTFFVGAGDVADTAGLYSHFGTTLVIGCMFLWCRLQRATGSSAPILAIGIGLAAATCLMLRQTTGGLLTASLVAIIVLTSIRGRGLPATARRTVWITVGYTIVIAPVVVWMLHNDIWSAFLDTVFLKGPASKGSLPSTLLRPFISAFRDDELRLPSLVGICLFAVLESFRLMHSAAEDRWTRRAPIGGALVCACGLVWIVIDGGKAQLRTPGYVAAALGMYGCLYYTLKYTAQQLFGRPSLEDTNRWVLAVLCFANTYAFGMSWALFENMANPSLAFVLAMQGHDVIPSRAVVAFRGVLLAAGLAMMALMFHRKMVYPFYWAYWAEPPLAASRATAKEPELDGFIMSPATASFFDGVTSSILANSTPSEKIFTYPHLHVFYGLTRRMPVTYGMMHLFDTCPDYVAIADAKKLRADPPAVIVAMVLPPSVYDYFEGQFRDGRPSGQRVLWATIVELSKDYDLVWRSMAPGWDSPVIVLSRKMPLRSGARPH